MKGLWFSISDNFIVFSQKHVPEGQFKWFLELVSYLQFVLDDIIDAETSQISEIHEARVQGAYEQ